MGGQDPEQGTRRLGLGHRALSSPSPLPRTCTAAAALAAAQPPRPRPEPPPGPPASPPCRRAGAPATANPGERPWCGCAPSAPSGSGALQKHTQARTCTRMLTSTHMHTYMLTSTHMHTYMLTSTHMHTYAYKHPLETCVVAHIRLQAPFTIVCKQAHAPEGTLYNHVHLHTQASSHNIAQHQADSCPNVGAIYTSRHIRAHTSTHTPGSHRVRGITSGEVCKHRHVLTHPHSSGPASSGLETIYTHPYVHKIVHTLVRTHTHTSMRTCTH